jgi:hypothetical protein
MQKLKKSPHLNPMIHRLKIAPKIPIPNDFYFAHTAKQLFMKSGCYTRLFSDETLSSLLIISIIHNHS